MNKAEAVALIAERRTEQDELRVGLVAMLIEWSTGPTPARARGLFARILELDAEIEFLAANFPDSLND